MKDIHNSYEEVRNQIAGYVVEYRDNKRFLTDMA